MDIIKYLTKHYKKENISFHMPGHKGSGIFKIYGFEEQLKNLVNMDITEIQGADNLYHADGIIKNIEERYSKLYGSNRSFALINGTTCGILASIMTCVNKDQKLLMTRASHKSVYNGVSLSGGQAVYLIPEREESFDVIGEIKAEDIEKALLKDPSISAVMITSPNYYGICSDIEAIAKVTHKYGKVLIVDQAHGAHLKIFEDVLGDENPLPMSAERGGADIVISSTHKTLASFTQSAVLNIMSSRVDVDRAFEKLQLVESTSPSYLLLLSHGMNLDILERDREKLIKTWKENINSFYKDAKKISGLDILECRGLDMTKINLSFSRVGISGDDVEKELLEKGINMELVTGHIIMAMTGIGNKKEDYNKLIAALDDISKKYIEKNGLICDKIDHKGDGYVSLPPGEYIGLGEKEVDVVLDDALNKVASKMVAPYPPGIPLLCPGEKVTEEILSLLKRMRRENKLIYGISKEGTIRIFEN